MTGRIKVIRKQAEPLTDAQKTIEKVTGKTKANRTDIDFTDQLTDQKYSWVSGAFSLGPIGVPSFAVILGVDSQPLDKDRRNIFCIAEGEYQTLKDLAKGIETLSEQWIDPVDKLKWYSDPDLDTSTRFNKFTKTIIHYGIHYNSPNPFKEYMGTLEDYMRDIVLGEGCPLLRTYMAPYQAKINANPDECPAVTALAYGISALMDLRPWEVNVNGRPSRYVDFGD